MNKPLLGRHLPNVEMCEMDSCITICSYAIKKSSTVKGSLKPQRYHALHMRHSSLFFSEQAMPSSCFFLSAVLSTVNWIALAAGFVLK